MSRELRLFVLALWLAFLARGVVHSLAAPMWDGFDEPFHLAYAAFVADHGRPPAFREPSFPAYYLSANRLLPSMVGHGAPTFEEWRRMNPAQQDARRRAMIEATSRRARDPYAGANYERQQGPLFYLLAALPFRTTAHASLPAQLVVMRLFCVALASVAVPLSARFLFRAGGGPLVFASLALVALAPNTIFYADRVTNESLAWLFVPMIGIALLELERSSDPLRAALAAGVIASLAIWTKLTLLPAIPAAAVAWWLSTRHPGGNRVRVRTLLLAVVLPLVATAILFAWNHGAGGGWTGLAEASATRHVGLGEAFAALGVAFSPRFWWQIFITHVWSGGWGFVRPGSVFYACAATLLLALVASAFARRRISVPRTVVAPVVTFVLFSILALMFHAVGGAIAARQTPGFPPIGAEGWYFDVMRTFEALLFGYLLLAAFGEERAARCSAIAIGLFATTDMALTVLLMLPRWSASGAFSGAAWSFDYAPVPMPGVTLAALTSYALALAAAIVVAMRSVRGRTVTYSPSDTASPSARIRTSSS